MRNRRRNFTLVELLVVIGIIAVLAGMLMAGIMYAPAKAQKAKSQAEITTLVNAIKQYESAYGVLPIPDGSSMVTKLSDDSPYDVVLTNDGYDTMITILQADTSSSEWTNLSDANKKKNKRRTKFLDIQGNTAGSYTDPWDNRYHVYLDYSYDGKIVLEADKKVPGISETTLRYNVVVYGRGNDRKDSKMDNGTAKNDEDNVYSFPTTWSSSTKTHTIGK